MGTTSWRVGLAMTALAAMGPQAHAQKSADTLRVVWWDQIANANPYYNQLRAGLVLAHQTMDGLIYRDPTGFFAQAGAGHQVGVHRPHHHPLHPAPGRDLPGRQRVHRR
jgi:hypothetical protein